ncbi:MAG: HAMP domain-containing histidine kinase [Pirellulales bacterium]|nr:HAMP domain-containing histidine kinase [Pirellulales bacterium]
MLSHWPLRTKLKLGLGLLFVTVLALFGSAYYGLYEYRGLVKSLSARSAELPLAGQVSQNLVDLRDVLSRACERIELPELRQTVSDDARLDAVPYPWDAQWLREEYCDHFEAFVQSLERYREQLDQTNIDRDPRLGDDFHERQTLAKIDAVVERMGGADLSTRLEEDWLLEPLRIGTLRDEAEELRQLVAELPSHLHKKFQALSVDVRAQYRTAIVIAWANAIIALVLLVTSTRLFYKWFAKPLEILVQGSREVASGNYDHRVRLDTKDEIGELAEAMNEMTSQFQQTRDDLDRQVRERTNQVVRSEQLASVGFLAAGVSHEINNPLASIALCSESLESRLTELLDQVDQSHSDDIQVAREYLQMIQREAFRCKQITEKLLDFARMGDSQRHSTDLRELTAGVIEMVQHLGKYQDKNLELVAGDPVIVRVNAQEIKQVVLNLITNGLESLDPDGKVRVTVESRASQARIIVEDNGCGMTEEVRKHLFEPFFTRRRSGQGTGLGLSITYRIVEEHQGTIEATSDGSGRGSRFVVMIPIEFANKENHHRYQAA